MLVKKYLKGIPACETSFPNVDEKKFHEFLFSKVDVSEECGEVLVVDFYSSKKELDKRFFTDGKNWITLDEGKWSTSNIDGGGYYYNSPEYIESEESKLISKEFFGKHDHSEFRSETASLIRSFIYNKNSEKRQLYADNKYQRMMNHIESIPNPPENIAQYCNEFVFENRYIVFMKEKKDKKTQCRCLHCGKDFLADERPKHKSTMVCPECRSEAKAIAERYVSSLQDKARLLIFYKVDGYIQKVWQKVSRRYGPEKLNNIFDLDPYYYEIETAKGKYAYHYVTSWWTTGFASTKYLCGDKAHVYADNIKEMFEGGWVLNMNLDRLRYAGEINFTNLMHNARTYPATWQLYKIGLYNLAASSTTGFRGNTFEEALGVSKNYLPIFKKYNVTADELAAVKMSGSFVNEETFCKLSRLMRIGKGYGTFEKMKEILKQMTFVKMVNYFSKQSIFRPKRNLADWFTLYLDYIKMMKELNAQLPKKKRIDLTEPNVKYPKDIQKAHDRVSVQLKIKKDANKDRDLKRISKRLEETHSFSYKNMTIVIPRGVEDFINEGNKLSHCVGSNSSYMKAHIEGKWCVLFIRKKGQPDAPFYTLTIGKEDHKVKECQGKCHKSMTPEVKKFVDAYLRFLDKARKPLDSKIA